VKPAFFSKRPAPQPRLSPARIPGRRSRVFWTDDEHAVLRAHYADRGAPYCVSVLRTRGFDRSAQAVSNEASKLKIRRANRVERGSYDYPEIDKKLAAAYPLLERRRGALKRLADELGVPRWILSKRLRHLGLARPHKKEPGWTEAELALLKKVPLHDLRQAARTFAAHGFRRSEAAIRVAATRRQISTRFKGGFSATAVAKILGIDSKTVTTEIFAGRLKATRRGTKRRIQQGGDAHVIEPSELRRYVIDNLERIDFRRVEKFALVQLLIGKGSGKS
jgi:hypothetical protein